MTETLAITGIGTLLSGDIADPVLDAEAVLVEAGRIVAIGDATNIPRAVPRVDIGGATLLPGLIDNHVHPVLGDHTPRTSQSSYIEGFVHGGVTSLVSAGEVHTPGRPRDRDGTKALAVVAHKAYTNIRPGGARVHAGALLLEDGLQESDFHELAAQGVHLVGEIGISGVQDPETAAQMTRWAQAAGMTVMVHVGGRSVPTSRTIDGEFCVQVRPDVAAHVNGGPTAAAIGDVKLILDETRAAVELVYNGNPRAACDVAELLAARAELDRLVIGTDSPAGAGVAPAGILRTLATICSMGGVAAPLAVAAATGNTARVRNIAGGRIAVGAVADLIVADAPDGSHASDMCAALEFGDAPAVAAVIIDGDIVVRRSRNTAPPKRIPRLPAT